jgi:hypothetical protein
MTTTTTTNGVVSATALLDGATGGPISSANPLPVTLEAGGGASTPVHTNPNVANATSVTLLAANADRRYLLVQNNSAANIALSLEGGVLTGIVPTVTNECIVLAPGASYESPSHCCPVGAITCYQTSGGSINTISVVEG